MLLRLAAAPAPARPRSDSSSSSLLESVVRNQLHSLGTASEGRTSINGKVQRIDGQNCQRNRRPLGRLLILQHKPHNLLCEPQHKQTSRYNQGAYDHEWPPTSPFRCILVGYNTDDGLNDEAGERASDPYQRCIGFGQAQIEEVRRAICQKLEVRMVQNLDVVEFGNATDKSFRCPM